MIARTVAAVAGCVLLAAAPIAAPAAVAQPAPPPAPVVTPVVLATLGHDTTAYTEGLELAGGTLYEGTGLVGQSQLRALDPATGAVRRASPVPGRYFGEGITVVGDKIWQQTYQDGVAVEWDAATLNPVREVPFTGEGWGLCYDGSRLISSDGTPHLRFFDPAGFTQTGEVNITRDGVPLAGANELECVDGQVWANVWPTDTIVRIDPTSGVVNLVVDASGLWQGGARTNVEVLNGIAHLAGDEYLLTGKDWPSMYRVRLSPTSQP
jgi:glutaminyl-peptide cyclotransferase